jgi:hypothetical protein
VTGGRLDVEVRAFAGTRFEPTATHRFARTGEGWVPLAPLEDRHTAPGAPAP